MPPLNDHPDAISVGRSTGATEPNAAVARWQDRSRESCEGSAATWLNAFTVDVEDYFQVTAFENQVDRRDWSSYPSRIEANTKRLLEQLAKHEVRGTFFVVGWIADHFPRLVSEIRDAGHEVGSHSYWHRLVYTLTPDEFREDVRRCQQVLSDVLNERITVFRAPSFSITAKSLWALEILIEEGFEIDSSIFPIYHDRYGIPDAEPAMHKLQTPSGEIWECPPAVVRTAGMNLPVSGGGYFRLLPPALCRRWLKIVNERDRRPFVFYVHPWEIDPHQPRLRAGTGVSRWRHYYNLRGTSEKLDRLLKAFRFAPLSVTLAQERERRSNASPRISTRHISTHAISASATARVPSGGLTHPGLSDRGRNG